MEKGEQVIIFVATKYTVDFLELVLNELSGLTGSYLYSKMDQDQRNYHLDNFRAKRT